jgi:DNA-binding NarL/FixJ family response regulator
MSTTAELLSSTLTVLNEVVARVSGEDTQRVLGEILRRGRAAAQEDRATDEGTLTRIRVVLVDDHQLIREGLRRALEGTGDFEVVGEAASIAAANTVLNRFRPDVLVTDMRLSDGDGITFAGQVRAAHSSIGIVILTMYAGDDQVFAALDAGASGFVGKDVPIEEVIAAARHAAANPRAFTARDLAGAMQRRMSAPAGPALSPREREVLDLLVDGLAIAQIARRLYISDSTTKTHVANIYTKLGAGNRAQAVMAAVRLGLTKNDHDDGSSGALVPRP